MVPSSSKPVRHPTGGTVSHAADGTRSPCPVRSPPMGDDCGGAHTIRRKGGAHRHIPNCLSRMAEGFRTPDHGGGKATFHRGGRSLACREGPPSTHSDDGLAKDRETMTPAGG